MIFLIYRSPDHHGLHTEIFSQMYEHIHVMSDFAYKA